MSIIGGGAADLKFSSTLPLGDAALWFPSIPNPGLSFTGHNRLRINDAAHDRPITLALFGSTPQELREICAATVHIDDYGTCWGIDVAYARQAASVELGVKDVSGGGTLRFNANSAAGERIRGIETLYLRRGIFLGYKVILLFRFHGLT